MLLDGASQKVSFPRRRSLSLKLSDTKVYEPVTRVKKKKKSFPRSFQCEGCPKVSIIIIIINFLFITLTYKP